MQLIWKKREGHRSRVSKAVTALLLFAFMVSFQMSVTLESNAASQGVSIQVTSHESVEVSWPAYTGAKSYTVLRAAIENDDVSPAIPADNEYVKVAEGLTGLNYVDTGLEQYKTYWYKVSIDLGDNRVSTIGPDSTYLTYDKLKNINACSNGDTVSITWDEVPGASKYAVTRTYVLNGNVIEDDFEKIVDRNIFTTESNPSRIYQYNVRPYLERNISGIIKKFYGENQGTTVCVMTAPKNVKAVVNNYNTVTVSFSEVEGATGYQIYRSSANSSDYVKIGTVNAGTTTYEDTNLTTGTKYTYRVEACKTAASVISAGVMSSEAGATPALEKTATITATSKSYNSIKLTWNKVAGAEQYYVYRSTSKNGTYKKIATVKKTTYTDKKLQTNKKFYYKVVAVRGTQTGAASKVVQNKAVPAATSAITVTNSKYKQLTIQWKKVTGATKYVLYRSTKPSKGFKKLGTLKTTSYVDSKVKVGTLYYYKVVPYRNKVKGIERVQEGVAVTTAVKNLKITNKSATANKITFSKTKGAEGYNVYRSTKKDGEYQLIGTTTKTAYTDKKAETGVKYYYKVCGVMNGYEGTFSEPKSITTKPAAVKNLKAEGSGAGKAKLTWDAQKGATSYQIYVSSEAKTGYRLSKEVTETTYVASLASNGTTYFRVYAVKNGVKGKYKQVAYTAISALTLNKTEANIKIGGALQLSATLAPAGATDTTVTWKTSNKKVATVTDTGVVTGKKNGTCTITATASNGMTATCKVTVSKVIIVLDPGHGGSDPGTSYNGVQEKNVNLKIAMYAKQELETYKNVQVIMTRTSDTYPSLIDRSQIAANYKADFFVSIHCNMLASKSTSVNGSEVYASLSPSYSASTGKMGNLVIGELVKAGMKNRGVKTVRGDNGADYYAVIRNTVAKGVPAILIEEGYLSGSIDHGVLTSDLGQKKLGVANATAIATYFELEKK